MNANDMIKKLYRFLGSIAAGNKSDDWRNETIDLFDLLFRNKIMKKNDSNTVYKQLSQNMNFIMKNALLINGFGFLLVLTKKIRTVLYK